MLGCHTYTCTLRLSPSPVNGYTLQTPKTATPPPANHHHIHACTTYLPLSMIELPSSSSALSRVCIACEGTRSHTNTHSVCADGLVPWLPGGSKKHPRNSIDRCVYKGRLCGCMQQAGLKAGSGNTMRASTGQIDAAAVMMMLTHTHQSHSRVLAPLSPRTPTDTAWRAVMLHALHAQPATTT